MNNTNYTANLTKAGINLKIKGGADCLHALLITSKSL